MSYNVINSINAFASHTDAVERSASLQNPGTAESSLTPYVRYNDPTEEGFKSEMKLRPLNEKIPLDENFKTVSTAVYLLTSDEIEGHRDYQNYGNWAGFTPKNIRKDCIEEGRAITRLVAETDEFEPQAENAENQIELMKLFAEEYIAPAFNIDNPRYQLLYSGNRSLHLEVDGYFEIGLLDDLRLLCSRFEQEHEMIFDKCIYSAPYQWRLPGARHRKTGLYKVEIDSAGDCFPACTQHQQVESIHSTDQINLSTTNHYIEKLTDYTAGDSNTDPVSGDFGYDTPSHLYKETINTHGDSLDKYTATNHISPYANTGDGNRSVIVTEVRGNPLSKLSTRNTYVPAHIHYAIGGDREYTRYNSDTLIRISGRDRDKWKFSYGDSLVIIGGRSRSSRIITVDFEQAPGIADYLNEHGREKTLKVLEKDGYDVGESGYKGSETVHNTSDSKAAQIKREIDRNERVPTYDDTSRVCCRLLQTEGFTGAMEWCEQTFGDDFDSNDTAEKLISYIETYDDYSHVDIPDQYKTQ